MKKIPLSQGLFALVDDDFELIHKWHVSRARYTAYAIRRDKKNHVLMHREIMGFPDSFVDHINGNGLDNRKENLRLVTHAENMRNRRVQANNKSGFRGVHQKKDGFWYAQIKIDGVQKYLGCYKTPQEASAVYEKEAEIQYGEFRRN